MDFDQVVNDLAKFIYPFLMMFVDSFNSLES